MSIFPNDTTFIQYGTTLSSAWAQDVNNLVYRAVVPGNGSGPITGTNQLLYSNGSNQLTWLPSVANAILITDGSGAPSFSTSGITVVGTIVSGQWEATPIGMTWGGSGTNLTPSNGGIVWTNSTSMEVLAGTTTARQALISGASVTPAWTPYTLPATLAAYDILVGDATGAAIKQITTAVNGVLITDGTVGVPSISSTLPTAVQGNITSTGAVTSGSWGGTYTTIVPLSTGGTNANLSAVPGAITYCAVGALALTAAGSSGQFLTGGTTPAFSTATYPLTIASGTVLGSSTTNTVTALTTLPSGVQGNITSVGTIATGTWNGTAITAQYGGIGGNNSSAANGAIPIGNGSGFTVAQLTAGTNITITPSSGGVTIASTGGSAGAMVKVGTTVASSTASITFSSFVANAYYELVLQGLLPATDGTNLWLRLGTGAGPTIHSASTDYNAVYETAYLVGSAASVNGEVSGGAAQMVLDDTIGGTTQRGISGYIRIYNPTIVTTKTYVTWELTRIDSSGNLRHTSGSGMYNTAGTAVTAAQVLFAAGNIATGQITCLSVTA